MPTNLPNYPDAGEGEGRILTPAGPLACRHSMYRSKRTFCPGKSVRSTRRHEEPYSWTISLSVRGAFPVPPLVRRLCDAQVQVL